ncbi:MAG: porin [Polyangiaceae bacterium]
MFERFGSPCVIAAASAIVLAATPAAAQGTPEATPPAAGGGASAGGSLSTGLSLGADATPPAGGPAAPAAEPAKADDKWEAPLAGYNGALYIRSKDDVFQTWFNGRLLLDFVKPFAAGAYPANQFSGFLVRRMRFENAGCIGDFCYSIQPEYGPTSVGNTVVGKNDGTVFSQPNQAPAARTSTQIASAFINYKIMPEVQVMAGIVQPPFGMEARQTTKYKDFLEDGVSTKFATPNGTEQGLTVWGATDKNMINYEVGVFSGDGAQRPNSDNRFDFMGRVFVRPLAQSKGSLSALQIGVSGKYGERDAKKVNYDVSPITTANGYALWGGTYTGAAPGGAVGGLTHIIPSGAQSGFAAELRVPVENFDLTGEFYYISQKTREQYDALLGSANTERFGELSGISYYAQASYWFGKRDITGEPGFFRIAKMKWKKPEAAKPGDKPKGPDTAFRVRVRYDNVSAKYEGAKDSGSVAQRNVAGNPASPIPFYDGDIKIHALQAGLDYFYTKSFGFRLNYGLYYTPDSAPATPEPGSSAPVATSANRAAAPANRIAAGQDDDARRGAHSIHELILRAQVAF